MPLENHRGGDCICGVPAGNRRNALSDEYTERRNAQRLYPGHLEEPLPSGEKHCRVHVEGSKKRIAIHCGPNDRDEDFLHQYLAACCGEKVEPLKKASEYAKSKCIGWLANAYCEYLVERIEAETTSSKTLQCLGAGTNV